MSLNEKPIEIPWSKLNNGEKEALENIWFKDGQTAFRAGVSFKARPKPYKRGTAAYYRHKDQWQSGWQNALNASLDDAVKQMVKEINRDIGI